MIPHIDRKKHPYAHRQAHKKVNEIVARAKRIHRWRKRKGYSFNPMKFIREEVYN
jgi:hypothetical protein